MVQLVIPSDLVLSYKEVMTLPGELEEMLPLWSSPDLPITVIQGKKERLVYPANTDFAGTMLPGKVKIIRLPQI